MDFAFTDEQLATANADAGRSFDFTCPGPTAATYTLVATGRAAKGMTGFGTRSTSESPAPVTSDIDVHFAGALVGVSLARSEMSEPLPTRASSTTDTGRGAPRSTRWGSTAAQA